MLRRVAANSAWLLGADVVAAALAFLESLVLARALGADGYGVLVITLGFVLILNRLTSFRMGEFVVKYLSDALAEQRPDRAGAVVKAALAGELLASVVALALVWAAAPVAARWLVRGQPAEDLFRLGALVIVGNSLSESSGGILQAFDRMRHKAVLTMWARAAGFAAVLGALGLGGGLRAVILAQVFGAFVSGGLLAAAALRAARDRLGGGWWRQPWAALRGRWRAAVRFALSTNVGATLSLVTRDGDVLWLGYFRSPAEVGFYKLALSVATALMLPLTPLAQATYPELAREAAARRWREFRGLMRKATLAGAAYALPVAAGGMLLGRWFIGLLYGPDLLPAATTLRVLLPGVAFASVFAWARSALLAVDRADYPMKVNLLLSAVKVPAMVALLPLFGHLGAAGLLSASYLVGVGLLVARARRAAEGQDAAAA